VLSRPELADDKRFSTNSLRVKNRPALQAAIETVFAMLSTEEVVGCLERARIANARMNSVAGFLAHPQLAGRDCWRDVGSPVGPLRALVPPVRMTGVEARMGDIPALGQQTDAILTELGIAGDTIADWRKKGTI
jgi:crotonobetainyl-CoA:carnitine CoA-transferase CaiB-like acyl-CoA transferase